MEEKYINLLLERCLNFDKSNSLFIKCDKINKDFVEKIIMKAKKMGIDDIYVDMEDIYLIHDKLLTLSLEEIEQDPYFNKSIWDEYAKKDASFLMLDTEFPHIMDDIEPNKVTRMKEINRRTRPLFRKKETSMQISWCIAAIGNEVWAKDLFPNETNAKELLDNLIYKCCMVDTNHPIESWNTFLETSKQLVEKLNHLQIKKLHYKNSLGTDLEIEMPKGAIWESAASEFENHSIVNMPSYEIFSSPHYLKVNGIVYSALPLIYGGAKIDKFFVEFKDGKVVNFDADMGKEILKGIIEGGDNSCYLGEVALVNHNSPISNTNVVFGTTLFDENASCHLAFGDGFTECIEGGENMTKEELLKHGVNQSDAHVDFMIGTDDLDIEAETNKGKVKIFERGNFCI